MQIFKALAQKLSNCNPPPPGNGDRICNSPIYKVIWGISFNFIIFYQVEPNSGPLKK